MSPRRTENQKEIAETGGKGPPVIEGDNRRISGGGPPDNDTIIARDERGRFRPGVSAHPSGRFKKGRSGNPAGRPKGSFRAGARAALAMADAASPALMETAIGLGRGGDGVSARFVLARTVGTRRGQPVEFDLPAITAPADLGAAVGAITTAVAEGSLTPEEAMHLSRMLDGFPRLLTAVPPEDASGEDHREALIRELDRIAATLRRRPKEERRAELLAQLAALDAEGEAEASQPTPLDVAVTEQQEEDQHDQQQPANAEPAAIAVTRIAVPATAEQQDQQHDKDDQAHGSSPFPARARARASEGLTTG